MQEIRCKYYHKRQSREIVGRDALWNVPRKKALGNVPQETHLRACCKSLTVGIISRDAEKSMPYMPQKMPCRTCPKKRTIHRTSRDAPTSVPQKTRYPTGRKRRASQHVSRDTQCVSRETLPKISQETVQNASKETHFDMHCKSLFG